MWWLLLATLARAEELTLQDAIERAVRNNLSLQVARRDLEIARQSWISTHGSYDPVLSLGVDTSESQTPSNDQLQGVDTLVSTSRGWTVGLSQALPTGATTGLSWTESWSSTNDATAVQATTVSDSLALTVRQPLLQGGWRAATSAQRSALIDHRAQELAWRGSLQQLVVDTSDAYWRYVRAERSLELTRSSLEIAQQQVDDTTERFDEGFAGSGDVLQAERALGSARQAEVLAEAELADAEASLALLLAETELPTPADRPQVPEQLPTSEQVQQAAVLRNLSLLQAENELLGLVESQRGARNSILPELDLFGSYALTGLGDLQGARDQVLAGDNRAWTVGADLSMPLPGRSRLAQLRQARLAVEQGELRMREARNQLEVDIERAVRDVIRDRSRVELAEQTLDYARRALAADQELAADGKASTRDVVLSLEALDAATVDLLQAQIDLQSSLLALYRTEGSLLGRLGLDPEQLAALED